MKLNELFTDTLKWTIPFQQKLHFSTTDIKGTDGSDTLCSLSLKDGRKLLFKRDTKHANWEFLGNLTDLVKLAKSNNITSIPEITSFIREMCKNKHKKLSESAILQEKKSEMEKLKDNKVPLTDEERLEVFKQDATWNYGNNVTNPVTGNKGSKVAAVWKSKDPKTSEITFVTNTHRAYNTAPTLKGAISRFHKFIKGTA